MRIPLQMIAKFGMGLIALYALVGCDVEKIEDREIKGMLEVDKSAMGNKDLEVQDEVSNMTRFILAGKKIVSIRMEGSKLLVEIMDSRRILLARISLKASQIDKKDYTADRLFISGSKINQNWDIEVTKKKIPLQTELLETRNSKICDNKAGLSAYVWRVFDYRGDYKINFFVSGTSRIWATLNAKGERQTLTEQVNVKACTSLKTIHSPDIEEYE